MGLINLLFSDHKLLTRNVRRPTKNCHLILGPRAWRGYPNNPKPAPIVTSLTKRFKSKTFQIFKIITTGLTASLKGLLWKALLLNLLSTLKPNKDLPRMGKCRLIGRGRPIWLFWAWYWCIGHLQTNNQYFQNFKIGFLLHHQKYNVFYALPSF